MTKAEINKLNLMQIMEVIIEKTNDKKLAPANIRSIQPWLATLGNRLSITDREALMLTALLIYVMIAASSFVIWLVTLTVPTSRFKPIGLKLSLCLKWDTSASARMRMGI